MFLETLILALGCSVQADEPFERGVDAYRRGELHFVTLDLEVTLVL